MIVYERIAALRVNFKQFYSHGSHEKLVLFEIISTIRRRYTVCIHKL